MAIAAKKVAAKSAPVAAKKAAPKPAPAAVEPEPYVMQVGDMLRFLGYGPEVAPDHQHLTVGEVYEIAEIDAESGEVNVNMPNPEFDASQPDTDDNSKFYLAPVLSTEVEFVPAEGDAQVEEAPAAPVADVAPAPAAAKKTAAAKKAPAAKAPAEPKAEEAVVDPETPDLENEDPAILAIVGDESADLVQSIIDLETQGNLTDWQIAGLLYHVKKRKDFESYDIDEKTKVAPYAAQGGWAEFVKARFNMPYRKAQHLIQTYVAFTQIGIDEPASVMGQIGWTKASKLAPIFLTYELKDGPFNKLMAAAVEQTTEGLSTYIDDKIKQKKGTPATEEKVPTTTVKFKFLEADGDHVKNTLTVAMETLAVKTLEEAFLAIVTAWATENAGGQASAAAAPVSRPVATKTAVKPVPRKVEVAEAA